MSIQLIPTHFIQFDLHTIIQFNQPIFVQCRTHSFNLGDWNESKQTRGTG